MPKNQTVTFRELIDKYKATRTAWEDDLMATGKPPHKAMVKASDRLVEALNDRAGIPRELTGEERLPMVGVLDDDGFVFVVVDNEWGQVPCIEAFLPAKPSDLA